MNGVPNQIEDTAGEEVSRVTELFQNLRSCSVPSGSEALVDFSPDAVEKGRLVAGIHPYSPVEFGQVPKELGEAIACEFREHAIREPLWPPPAA